MSSSPHTGPITERPTPALALLGRSPDTWRTTWRPLPSDDEIPLVARTRLLPQTDLVEWDVPGGRGTGTLRSRPTPDRVGAGDEAFAVPLVVSELVTNAIRYGALPITLRLLGGDACSRAR